MLVSVKLHLLEQVKNFWFELDISRLFLKSLKLFKDLSGKLMYALRYKIIILS